jgi:hypothetical protein
MQIFMRVPLESENGDPVSDGGGHLACYISTLAHRRD